MHDRRIWSLALAVIFTLIVTTGYVSAQIKSRSASQLVGRGADGAVTFRVRIQNISPESDVPTLLSPGVWVMHSETGPLFTSGEADRGEGLEALAEDGDPTKLAASLRAQGLQAGVFDTPVCADTPGLLPSSDTVEFGDSYEFEVTASPETPYLSFATMLVQSNDLFLAPSEKGIALFDENGMAIGVQYVTAELLLWDAGTEANEEPGVGPNQAPRQSGANTGAADELATVRPVDDGFSYPDFAELVEVYIVQVPMVERDRRSSRSPSPDHAIGETLRVGNVQWRVISAENVGHAVKNGKGDSLTTDERFVLVRFKFQNLGSDPVEFDGGPRNRKGVSLVDKQGREYTYYLVPNRFGRDDPPRKYISEDEDCYGEYRWGIWRPYILKPNTPTTCSIIYDVNVDATGLVFVASDLGDNKVSDTETVDLNLRPIPRYSVGEYVRVGDVRWQVLAVEDLGHELEENSKKAKTEGRFLRVQFQLWNKGSETLDLDAVEDIELRDSQGNVHKHYLVPRIGLPDRYPEEFIPDDEECTANELKPNIMTTCTAIYEVDTKTTGSMLVASDLGGAEDGAELIDLGLSPHMAIPFYLMGEDVETRDVCWRVLSADNLGRKLKNNGDRPEIQEETDGQFIQVRFRFLNMGSETLKFEDALLIDEQNRVYEHFHIERDLMPDRHPLEYIPDDEECFHIQLKPNAPKACTIIYEVADDAENFALLAGDLEGYETQIIALPTPEPRDPCPVARGPIAPGGPYSVCKEVSPGVYREEAAEDSFCKWARLKDLSGNPGSIIAMDVREGQFYVEILDSDAAFTTECELVPFELLEPREPLLTSIPAGMYIVGLDIGPGKYQGEPQDDLFCFWQRLSNFRREDDSTIAWDIPGDSYVVEVASNDYAVEFACPVQKVE